MNPLDQLHEELTRTYSSVFVAYHRAHIAHINIRSRTFYSDHKLLQKIYEFLQDTVDMVGEKIQSCGLGGVPDSIGSTVDLSSVEDAPVEGDADELLHTVWEDINTLIDVYHDLADAAREVNYPDVENMAADHIGTIATFAWKIEATLDLAGRHTRRAPI
jgi:DNA-binding ferritin-like protein